MSEAIPLTITIASLQPDFAGNIHDYDATIPGRITILAQQSISLFKAGTTEPTSDEGLWFDQNVNQWKYFDYDTGNYQPVNVPQQNLRYHVGADEPDQLEYLLWIVLDVNGQGEDIRTYYNGQWRSVMVGTAHAIPVYKSTGEGFNSIAPGDAGNPLVSNGPGAAPSFQAYDSNPVGTLIIRALSATPAGYLPCDGGDYLRSAYPVLSAALQAEGFPYGAGDGVNTFTVPDGRGRYALGYGTGTASDATPHDLGDEIGTERHALTSSENGPHTHTFTINEPDESTPSPEGTAGTALPSTPTATSTTSSSGLGTPHNNMPPSFVGRWFIRAY